MRCPTLADLPAPAYAAEGWPWTEESQPLPETRPGGGAWPRISVVTPSLNQAQYIEETIRSVLLQGYPNLEYILIDGGSTDGSVELIRKYEPWLTCWVSEPDRGQAEAINKGWSRASGELLAYLNSDDVYLPGAAAGAAQRFLKKPQAGMVYGSAAIIDTQGSELRTWEAWPFDFKIMLTEENIVPQPAAFYSREALESLGCLDEGYHMIMDYELAMRLGVHFLATCLPGKLAKFRDHASSKTRTQSEIAAEELLRFASCFFSRYPTWEGLQSLRPAAFGRFYYMLALGIVARGRGQARRALKPLLQSMRVYPAHAWKRPLQTAYILKEVFLSGLVGRRRSSAHQAS